MGRERQAQWDAQNMKTVATKLTKKEYQQFKIACDTSGITQYEILQRMIRVWVRSKPRQRFGRFG